MNAGFFRKIRKNVLIAILCLCLAAGAAGGTYAFLTAGTDPISNEFVPAKVTCAVEEVFTNGIKEDVLIRNTGNIDAYIRSAVVITFVSGEGEVLSATPQEGVDYNVTWGALGWKKGTDGYWYYKNAVAPDALTEVLIDRITAISAPEGYRLNVQIIATAIQAAPDTAVQNAWGVSVSNGEIVPN